MTQIVVTDEIEQAFYHNFSKGGLVLTHMDGFKEALQAALDAHVCENDETAAKTVTDVGDGGKIVKWQGMHVPGMGTVFSADPPSFDYLAGKRAGLEEALVIMVNVSQKSKNAIETIKKWCDAMKEKIGGDHGG